MSAPRLEIDLDKLQHNARNLVDRLAILGISTTGVTKAILGDPRITGALLRAGVHRLGDSRIENIEAMSAAGVDAAMTLLRSPMLSQVERVVAHADVSFNTEFEVLSGLSSAAQGMDRVHGIVLMVELGDLREGILPGDLEGTLAQALRLPNLSVEGIGTNLACQSGVVPDAGKMTELSKLADWAETRFGLAFNIVSGGNSANLPWALGGAESGRINDLRLGESILLGREPLHRQPIDGLHLDGFTLVAEVIESKVKPARPWGDLAQSAFGTKPPPVDHGVRLHTVLAIGQQDVDPLGLTPPPGLEILGASSDHLIIDAGTHPIAVGSEVRFQLDYSALLRAMTAPYVTKVLRPQASKSLLGPAVAAKIPGRGA